MGAPNYHNFAAISGSKTYDRLGSAGKYHNAEVIAAGATGSAGGAFILGNGAAHADTQIYVDGGGMIVGTDLNVKEIYNIGFSEIRATGGNVIIFKRQDNITT